MAEKHVVEKIKERAERAIAIASDAGSAYKAAMPLMSSIVVIMGICEGYLEGRKEPSEP